MTEEKILEAVTSLVQLLAPLTSEERKKAITASMTIIGDEFKVVPSTASRNAQSNEDVEDGSMMFPIRVRTWIKQNGIVEDELLQVFHFDNGQIEVIANDIPGGNAKEKTHNSYILMGLSSFLLSGESLFSDTAARELCRNFGCFNAGNHSRYIDDRGNELSGNKDKGWSLTVPGLKHAATLIKQMTKASS